MTFGKFGLFLFEWSWVAVRIWGGKWNGWFEVMFCYMVMGCMGMEHDSNMDFEGPKTTRSRTCRLGLTFKVVGYILEVLFACLRSPCPTQQSTLWL